MSTQYSNHLCLKRYSLFDFKMAYSCPCHAYQFVFVLTEKSNLLLLILSISQFEQIKLSFTVLTTLKGSLSLLILSVLLKVF